MVDPFPGVVVLTLSVQPDKALLRLGAEMVNGVPPGWSTLIFRSKLVILSLFETCNSIFIGMESPELTVLLAGESVRVATPAAVEASFSTSCCWRTI